MAFEVNHSVFRKGIRKVIQVSISRATPWYEYQVSFDGLVHKMECNVVVDAVRVRSMSLCREVEKAKSFALKPVLIIEPGNGVLTVVTVD